MIGFVDIVILKKWDVEFFDVFWVYEVYLCVVGFVL